MKKILAVLLLALLFSWQCFAEMGLPNNRFFMRRLGFARTLAGVDQIVEEARKLDSDYREAFSKTAEWRQKLRETNSWFPDILISANFRRRELLLENEKEKPVSQLSMKVFDENFSIEDRVLAADAIMEKSSELSVDQAIFLVKKMTQMPAEELRAWAYANMSNLVPVSALKEEIAKGLLDPSPGVVANTVNIVSEQGLSEFYGLLYNTVQIDYDRTMGNSSIALARLGILGSVSIPFLSSVLLTTNSFRIGYARPTLVSIIIKTINVLFYGNICFPIAFVSPEL
jgi:hypothetical protein